MVAEADGGRRSGPAEGGGGVSAPEETTVRVNGTPCRVWRKGDGERLVVLAGIGGLLRWTPFLDRLAAERLVIAPSLPGFPGGGSGHQDLDSHLDWLVATSDLLEGAGLEGADLVGLSVGGALAADVAAMWPRMVRRLVLVAPFGLFDAAEPVADIFAQRPKEMGAILCADGTKFDQLMAPPDGEDPVEWRVLTTRANEAAARILWPVGDTRLGRRLYRVSQPTLLLWGEEDRVIPPSYAKRFAEAIAGPTTIQTIAGAGHMADLDAPEALGRAVLEFLG